MTNEYQRPPELSSNEYLCELIEFHKAEGDSMAEIVRMFSTSEPGATADEIEDNRALHEALCAFVADAAARMPADRTTLETWAISTFTNKG